jgi:hypothetical protein
MLKIMRFFINFVFCMIVILFLTLAQIGMFDLMALQSNRVDAIHIATGSDEEVGYFDSYGFWGTDIGAGMSAGAKYRVRNLFAWKWWKVSMKYVDIAIDFVISAVKPILVPVAQINAVADYYGMTMDDFVLDIIDMYGSETEAKDALYELYVIHGRGFGTMPGCLEGYEYSDAEELAEIRSVIDSVGSETAYARWVRNNKKLYNINWKLSKYNINNGETYAKYANKFLENPGTDTVYIKPAAVVLYYQTLLAIILGILFVIKYPINLFQARFSRKKDMNE